MLISFLICGMTDRPWEKLLSEIKRQIKSQKHPCEVLVTVDSGEHSSGKKRNRLVQSAAGEYIAFIDDDDEVSKDYVSSLANAAAEHKTDIVSFIMEVSIRKTMRHRLKRTEKWKLGLWDDNRRRGKMSANHLCCWKREIATKVAWCDSLGYGDDQLWYGPLNVAGIAKTCHFINRVLYKYLFVANKTKNQTSQRVIESRRYFGSGLRCFMVNGEIFIEDGCQEASSIQCRSLKNEIVDIDARSEKPFHVVKLV